MVNKIIRNLFDFYLVGEASPYGAIGKPIRAYPLSKIQ